MAPARLASVRMTPTLGSSLRVWTHDQDRAGGAAHALVADRSEGRPTARAVAAGADYEHPNASRSVDEALARARMDSATGDVNCGKDLDARPHIVHELIVNDFRHLVERRFVPLLPAGRASGDVERPNPNDDDRH